MKGREIRMGKTPDKETILLLSLGFILGFLCLVIGPVTGIPAMGMAFYILSGLFFSIGIGMIVRIMKRRKTRLYFRDLQQADMMIDEGKQKMDSGNFQEAIKSFQEAMKVYLLKGKDFSELDALIKECSGYISGQKRPTRPSTSATVFNPIESEKLTRDQIEKLKVKYGIKSDKCSICSKSKESEPCYHCPNCLLPFHRTCIESWATAKNPGQDQFICPSCGQHLAFSP